VPGAGHAGAAGAPRDATGARGCGRGPRSTSTLVAFVVDDVDAAYDRLRARGVEITTPIETEPWGERYFQITDPGGVVLQLVQWVDPPGGA